MEKNEQKYVSCPFCKSENDFDLIGLKFHLQNYCEAYDNVISVEEEREARRLFELKKDKVDI